MTIIKNENVSPFDVDETLILHLPIEQIALKDRVSVYDPVDKGFIILGINRPMVRLLKEEFQRGSHVIVWSRGGHEWAANVVKALDLSKQVHLVMTKPLVYFDDKAVADWLPYRVYLKPDTVYKSFKA